MAVSNSPRLGLEQYSSGADPHPGRVKSNDRVALLEALVAVAQQGTTAQRPAAGKARAFYWDTTVDRLYFDNGTTWKEVTTNGGGGAGSAIVPGAAAVEGTSGRSARADHTHSLPLATAAVDGAMSKTDKAKLDAANSLPTPSTLVMLDANGRTQVAAPSAAGDTANKSYVDTQVGTKANTSHTHAAADITSGTFATARIPVGTTAAPGSMSAADKTKLDAASAAATPSTIVMLDANGRAQVATPALAAEITNKSYVDTQVATKANTSHTHAWADITSGVPTTFTPAAHTHAAADVTSGTFAAARLPAATGAAAGSMSAADKTKLDNATALATPSTLVMLDASGRAAVAAPSGGGDIANKTYVDAQVATRAASSHTHPWTQITSLPASFTPSAHTHVWADLTDAPATFTPSAHTHSATDINTGTLSAARLPAASGATAGSMSAADKTKLDNASAAATANTLVLLDAAGRAQVAAPSVAADIANKSYVDSVASGKAATTHTHTWAQITNPPATYAPSAHTHPWADITGVPTASATQTGLMSSAAYNVLYGATAVYDTGNIVMRDNNGNIQINRPTADIHGANKLYVDDQMNAARAGKLDVATFTAAISTSATARAIRSPNVGSWMTFYDNGVVEAPTIYSTNAASGSNFRAVWVNSTGGLGYNLSSEKFKTNIRAYEVPLEVLDQVEPKRFQYKENVEEMGDAAPWRVNFLAEDIHDAGLTEYVSYDGEGTERENCQTINEQLMVNALWSFARQQRDQITKLQDQLNELAAS
ncbi:minor tail protein [Arthrobacter phage KBurrousTX]|uniref:Minor tail protein n=1 Tax=Arthrobacter phage KBurrousTX TaxID=2315608 RepID=A0A386K896_9CAUD|nr:minor tail protein [Arthrobacter phage KBurrousTX]AYD81521.1 minor tail protein [Arthrobacter phage KBurrousTX]